MPRAKNKKDLTPEEKRAQALVPPEEQPYIEQLASGNQDGMRNISQKNFRLVEFPIPSLEEQKAIVSLLSNYLQKNETIKTLVQCVIKRIDSLKHSILARVFRGELGTNDPAEPATEL